MQRTIKITGDLAFFNKLAGVIGVGANDLDLSDASEQVFRVAETLSDVTDEMALFSRATLLKDTAYVAIYEHPDRGDEAPLMVHVKRTNAWTTESFFWEVSDVLAVQRDLV